MLLNLGYRHVDELQASVRAWKNLFAMLQPDLLVCDHSPTALLVARGMPIPKFAIAPQPVIPVFRFVGLSGRSTETGKSRSLLGGRSFDREGGGAHFRWSLDQALMKFKFCLRLSSLPLWGIAALVVLAVQLPAQQPPMSPLLEADFPGKQWISFNEGAVKPLGETWKIQKQDGTQQPILICTGEPFGYLRTQTPLQDFEFGVQWRYPANQNGNSGVLLFTSGGDRLWPDALQIQLHHSTAGSTFPIGSAKSDNELRNVPALSRPIGEWNECVVTSLRGRVVVTVNGKRVGEVTGCTPNRGTIALQSEGTEIHFREIWIRDLSGTESATKGTSYALPADDVQLCKQPLMRSRQRKFYEVFENSLSPNRFSVAFPHRGMYRITTVAQAP